MKRFEFSPERVLAWRRMQARVERMRWEQMRGELRAIEIERENLRAERDRSQAELQTAGRATGEELAALDKFHRYVDAEHIRLRKKRVESEKRIAVQAGILAAKDREVKVLEHLRERKLAAWTAEWDRETEQMASEAFLSRWHLRDSRNQAGATGLADRPSRAVGTNVK